MQIWGKFKVRHKSDTIDIPLSLADFTNFSRIGRRLGKIGLFFLGKEGSAQFARNFTEDQKVKT